MKRVFHFEFEDESCDNTMSFEYDELSDERLITTIESGVPVIYANRSGFAFLARAFAKMALSSYEEGFHVHLRKNLDADEEESLRVILNEEEAEEKCNERSGLA